MAHLPALSSSSSCTVLKEAISLFAKSPRVLSSLFVISLLAGSLLFSAFKFSTVSLHADVVRISAAVATTDRSSPAYRELLAAFRRDAKELLSLELVYLVVSMAVTYTLTAVNICALAAAQGGKPQETLRGVLRDAKPSLAGALVTQLLVAVLNLGYILVVAMAAMLICYLSDTSVLGLSLAAALGVAAAAWWMYLMAIFSLSVVVAVVEQGTRGWKAISRAEELIRGSMWQGVGIVVVVVLVVVLPGGVAQAAATRWLHLGLWGQFCVGLGYVVVLKVVYFVELGAFVVLHSGCKWRHSEEAAVARKLGYVSVPTADVV